MTPRPGSRAASVTAAVARPVTPQPPARAPAGSGQATRQLTLGGRTIPVILPSRHDPRLKLSVVIFALQILGQTVLDFKVSIAQILVTIGVCALVDAAVTFKRQQVLAWPASALLTGNSIAFILRASGTRHGDWWSLHGIEYFILAALMSLLVKYLVRPGGRHRFNPSNIGIVWVLLVIGPVHVFPQYLWWGPLQPPVIAALVVIGLGALWVLRAVQMLPMALSFLVPFTVLIAVFAAAGQSFVAIWQDGAIGGFDYWLRICASPELLVFVCFMMSDPATAARTPAGRCLYGAATAVVAAGLVVVQPTEFGIKVAILSSLTVMCALVPLIDAIARRPPTRLGGFHMRGVLALRPATIAVIILSATALAGTAALAHDKDLIYIERGLTGPRNAQ